MHVQKFHTLVNLTEENYKRNASDSTSHKVFQNITKYIFYTFLSKKIYFSRLYNENNAHNELGCTLILLSFLTILITLVNLYILNEEII